MLALRILEWAPFPVAKPGHTGSEESQLTLGAGWGDYEGTTVPTTRTDVGQRAVEVPLGQFENAWYVEGRTPDWEAKFWWVHRVGFVRMLYSATDGRQLDFELEEIRSVD